MSALQEAVPADHVVRLCASYEWLSAAQCSVPDRCLGRDCERCRRRVHYDPRAAIPLLGPEFILCDICLDELLEDTT